jgi:DNA-binding XRE family transcriptional regulator
MNKTKIEQLNKKGWKTRSASEFLNLSAEEAAYVELKLSLSCYLSKKRTSKHWTQEQLAEKIHSSQSRIAKMEKGDPTVTVDLLVKSLFALGTSKNELAKVIK